MAFFKFRKGGDDHAAAPSASVPESLESMRKRARHRLIGAAVLVLLGVICFPLLFDSQPRPIAVDIAIEIPDKNKVKPLRAPAPANSASVAAKPAASAEVVVVPTVASASTVPASRVAAGTVSSDGMITEYASKPEPKPQAKPESKPVDKPVEKAADKAPAQETAKASAAASAKEADKKPAAEGRFVVQIGAFADAAKAHEARMKLERAGLKTYAQVIESKDGRRIRVRVGPFPSKHEAEKVGEKIKKLDLPVGILEL